MKKTYLVFNDLTPLSPAHRFDNPPEEAFCSGRKTLLSASLTSPLKGRNYDGIYLDNSKLAEIFPP